jgi:hypothetical protein
MPTPPQPPISGVDTSIAALVPGFAGAIATGLPAAIRTGA